MSNRQLGIDISKWQDEINWDKVSEDFNFAIIKTSEATVEDKKFKENYHNSLGKIKRGFYHFFRNSYSPIAQADFFWNLIVSAGGEYELDLTVDMEETYAQATRVKQFLDRLEALSGKKPVIYTSRYYWDDAIGIVPWAKDYKLWVAQYPYKAWQDNLIQITENLNPTPLPLGWDKAYMWQFTEKFPGKERGYTESYNLDLDWLFEKETDKPQPTYQKAIVLVDRLIVRTMPESSYASYTIPLAYTRLYKNDVVEVLETYRKDNGDTWIRIGYKQFIALRYKGVEYSRIIK